MEKQLQLQPRLRLLADMTPQGCCLADIGTDHGYLPVRLLLDGRVVSAIAADIGAEPLAHARRTAAQYGVEAGLDFRLCDGLRDIAPEEADTVVIAGMGGETIIAILSSAPWTKDGAHTLLLQPMTKAADLRRWLSVNGYAFTEERLVRDKNYLYPVLRVTGGTFPPLTELQALTGVALDGEPLYGEYLSQQEEKLRRAADGLRRSRQPDAQAQAEKALTLARKIEEKRCSL